MRNNKGKNNPSYIDGRCSKEYHCADCGKVITYKTILRGGIRCRKCVMNTPEMKEKLRLSHLGKSTWNKGLKGVQKGYWIGKSNKNIIINHHIDANKKNNHQNNLLKMVQCDHRSLHQRGYEYLVKIGLVYDYLKEFQRNHISTILGKVVHHVDCNRANNEASNLLLIADRAIHNKLHQEAYNYLVRNNRVNDYISWFFLQKKNNHQSR